MIVRVFAHEYPARVAALVLVDSSTEDFNERRAALLHEPLDDYPAHSPIDWRASFAQAKALTTLGDKPLIVLTADAVPPDEPAAAVALWFRMQADLARLSTHGTHRIVPHTTHLIPLEAPQAITTAVLEVTSTLRSP